MFTIVEGAGASSKREFARFLDMSIRSTMEVESELELSHDYGVLDSRNWRSLSAEDVEIRKMLCGLRARILRDLESDGQTSG